MRESAIKSITEAGSAQHFDTTLPLARSAQIAERHDADMADLRFLPLTVEHLGDGNLRHDLSEAQGQTWAYQPPKAAKQKYLPS